ncbi:MAG: acylneuraminate cytidylyltransferase family protein [Gemmatimonadetes bacterium]|nr:acylneuraminate cytidylyltransferase family protein [Gemmatimonadota bacterium]
MILGVIPARGGSKGLSRKNIRSFCGRPLIAWSIAAAREANLIDRFIVSTEDAGIAEVARFEGAEILPRPASLATDDATTVEVLKHVLEHIKAEVIVLLQPTCPIRRNRIVDRAIERFLETEADSLATGYVMKALEWGTHINLPRHKIKGFFYDDGNVYVHRAEVLQRGMWYGERLECMLVEHYYSLDIDDEIDFWAAEAVMEKLQSLSCFRRDRD